MSLDLTKQLRAFIATKGMMLPASEFEMLALIANELDRIAALEAEASEGERLRALLADIHRTSPKPFRLDRPGLTHGQAAEIGYGALRDAIQTRVAVALILEAPAREGE